MSRTTSIRFDLGIPHLFTQWKSLFTTKYLGADLAAGITVAFLAIPLSLAIALASGVSPGTGLITAIIAGIVCALFGGTPLSVSGPAAAMSVLIADLVEKFGLQSLVIICLIAGVMQLISGMLGLGRLARYVPLPVIAGFTAGIGVIILISQLPRAFGLEPPPESQVFSVLIHIKDYFHETSGASLFITIMTILLVRGLPYIFRRLPPILPAVAISTLLVYVFNLKDVPLVGDIPHSLPAPHLPSLTNIPFSDLLLGAFTVYLLASLETLLSSSAVDKLTGSKKHDSNQELIGQGLGNISVSLFGGIPITGVIARSATNVKAGARTRRSSIIHSLIILLAVFAAAPIIAIIPIAALAGILLSIAYSMINYREFIVLWRMARSEAIIYSITFLSIISVDLIAGVQAGICAAALILLWKASKTYSHISTSVHDGVIRLSITGPLTFLSIGKISELENKFKEIRSGQTVMLDLANVTNIDTTGASAIVDLYQECQEKKIKFYIKGLPRRFESLLKVSGGESLVDNHYLVSEHALKRKDNNNKDPRSSRGRLIHGIQRFHIERNFNDKRLFESIRQKQDPHTLFITCSDSRVVPSLITSSDPGELFIMRNIGNFIPPYPVDSLYSESAAIEFALASFDITDVVICGHTSCGAIVACCEKPNLSQAPGLEGWIAKIRAQLEDKLDLPLSEVIRANVLNQVENLKSYPIVQEKLQKKEINIHAWFYDFEKFLVFEYDVKTSRFKSLVDEVDPIENQ